MVTKLEQLKLKMLIFFHNFFSAVNDKFILIWDQSAGNIFHKVLYMKMYCKLSVTLFSFLLYIAQAFYLLGIIFMYRIKPMYRISVLSLYYPIYFSSDVNTLKSHKFLAVIEPDFCTAEFHELERKKKVIYFDNWTSSFTISCSTGTWIPDYYVKIHFFSMIW